MLTQVPRRLVPQNLALESEAVTTSSISSSTVPTLSFESQHTVTRAFSTLARARLTIREVPGLPSVVRRRPVLARCAEL